MSATIKYRSDIDGLRAVAILLVVLFHAGITGLPGGFVGVDIFFVISGFLIGGIISKEIKEQRFSFYQFFLRRIRRIAPALFFIMMILLLACYFLLSPLEYSQLAKYSVGVFLSLPNIVLLKGSNYFSTSADLNPLLMTWSLGIEEQFYIVLPFILLFAARFKRNMATVVTLLSLLSFAASVFLTPRDAMQAFYLLPTRAWELGAGVLLALWKPQPLQGSAASALNLLGLLLIGAAALLISKADSFPGYLALVPVPVLGACLMIGARGRINHLLLANGPMRFIGKVSYSWYLWHWPLLSLARIFSDGPLSLMQSLSICALALMVAWFSWRMVEQPFRQPLRRTKRIIPAYCVLSAMAATCMAGVWASGGLKYRVSEQVNNGESFKISAQKNPCLLDYGANLPSRDSRCQPIVAQPGIALVGDSHAAALRVPLAAYAMNQQKPLLQLTKASSPLLSGVTRAVVDHPQHAAQCAAFNQEVMKTLLSDRVDEVVISAFWAAGLDASAGAGYRDLQLPETGNLAALKQGMDAVITQLQQAGKKVTLIQDAPALMLDPLRYSHNRNIPLRRTLSRWLGGWQERPAVAERTQLFRLPSEALERLLDSYQQSGVTVLSLRDKLCNDKGCLIIRDGLPLYYDNNHLSPYGGEIALGKNG